VCLWIASGSRKIRCVFYVSEPAWVGVLEPPLPSERYGVIKAVLVVERYTAPRSAIRMSFIAQVCVFVYLRAFAGAGEKRMSPRAPLSAARVRPSCMPSIRVIY